MWLELQIFGLRALWSPYFLTYIIILALLYFLITGPYRHKFGGTEKPSGRQQIYFYLGLFLLYVIKGSPIDLLTHITLTAHMIQMAIYYLVFPILIIKGIPAWIWRKVVYAPVIKPIVKVLTKPIVSLLLFNSLFSIYHIPAIFNFSKSSLIAHSSISIIILIAAFIVWWPIVSPLKEFDTMSPVLKMGYILANGVLITPACALIIFADQPLYAAYTQDGAWLQALALCVPGDVLTGIAVPLSGPEMFTSLSTMYDQQLGGIIMKVVQEITYGILLASVFFKWVNKEGQKVDPVPAEIN
ncbi:cytochrome c oxidase assembly factor CtaG [Virgibacillus sp. NKC19-16]|uniref:cytochrome c oxidase assembly factor CtaG n=1 Tax=Virgibacillus salidurans TaxID=2831673 RepID=UPI001F1A6063|nr:cytochrome c oxidase assembly factor CtaG [Virgibacillus sp. NKC19-16]UJL47826.1 cytochrome c oxidase assembly factor CtaG [Virgibacillus sp. NKC19-16]